MGADSSASDQPARGRTSGPLDRALGVFSDVRAGEGGTALLLLVNILLVLLGYYVLKTVREPLILATGGAKVKSYAAAGQAAVLMGFIPLYGWVASRVDRFRLVVGLTLFFVLNIELFALAAAAQLSWVGVAFYIWVGIFSLTVIAQFWSFANDLYTREEGDRLFPIIGVGMTLGSPLGSKLAADLFRRGASPPALLHLAAAILLLTAGLYALVHRRIRPHAASASAPGRALPGGRGGFGLVLASPYLRLVAGLMVLLNVVNTTGEFILSGLVVERAEAAVAAGEVLNKGAFIGHFYGDYFFYVNLLAVVLQAFATSRIVKYLGLGGALLALPMVALGSYGLVALGGGLAAVRWAKTAENSTDYSIMNTARQLLWLPTSREEKYKAKQAIDAFFTRFGDLISAGVVFVGAELIGLSTRGFAGVNLAVIGLWIVVAVLVLGRNRALVRQSEASQ